MISEDRDGELEEKNRGIEGNNFMRNLCKGSLDDDEKATLLQGLSGNCIN